MEEFLTKNVGAIATVIAALIGAAAVICVARKQRRTAPTDGSPTTHQTSSGSGAAVQIGHARDVTTVQGSDAVSVAEGMARGLAEAHLDRFSDYETRLRDKETEIAALESAVEALQAARDSADAPADIDEALTQFRAGDTAKAEEIFRSVLERCRAEGQGAFKGASARSPSSTTPTPRSAPTHSPANSTPTIGIGSANFDTALATLTPPPRRMSAFSTSATPFAINQSSPPPTAILARSTGRAATWARPRGTIANRLASTRNSGAGMAWRTTTAISA